MPVPPGGCSSYAPCQSTALYGDPGAFINGVWTVGAWSPQTNYTQTGEVDNVTCTASSQTWQPTGVQVLAGESLSILAGGEAFHSSSAYCYPEGAYPGGVRHLGQPSSGPAPGGDFEGQPILSLIGNSQALSLKFTATNVQPTWVGHDTGLAFPGRSSIILADQMNGGAGCFVWVCLNDNVYTDNSCCYNVSFRRLSPSGGGGTGANFLPASYGVSDALGCYCTITITLVDTSGAPYTLKAGETQQFTLVADTGTFAPAAVVNMVTGQSTATEIYRNDETGNWPVTILVGPGVLQLATPVPMSQMIFCDILCAITDPIFTANCALTRPQMREMVRQIRGIPTPANEGYGVLGMQPLVGFPYPDNLTLNQAISMAIAKINQDCNLHLTAPFSVAVPPVASNWTGPQFLNLQGMIGCPTQVSINTVRRATFQAPDGTILFLFPTSYQQQDRGAIGFDNYAPGAYPYQYWVDGNQIALLPAVSAPGGTLTLYLGTGFPNFATDQDTIDQIPLDFQSIVAYLAAYYVCLFRPNEPGVSAQMPGIQMECKAGIEAIKKWKNRVNESLQASISLPSWRTRPRVR